MNRMNWAILPVALAALVATPATASGTMSLPEQKETLSSYRSCVVRLKQAMKEDKAAPTPRKLRDDGSTREVTLDMRSKGVEKLGKQHARYEARIWYHHGRATAEGSQIEVSHSWEHRALECKGNVLTINASNGFTSSTFEPAS
ncbi:hypothetical protein [Sphingorhabdus pulchriflava]|nr:hypothetical protein [Sphingorhabdus pulchriflava]